ncbi:hypothetical protein VF14_21045 [Nostoc linckia z18]|uniref:Uncharacterized protein n=2 Tax=Nostoc linckia TaxID=92942 RepID=A0A9Q5ZAK2_NOSLI|nr:hypothetical protein [Nostoc linckia]PHK40619.1 hypothetical protein VF12_09770 [Nostoc linckia z15]PHK44474.1 hypothetical protein VF13_21645 [Nostoc linckia z16]PHJ58086.1 hypothetical protein VF02_28555 [Nostoc linckia z1]PHJ60626.1 hypothetical protein VF05_30180 [Nostoc linckia z3]PHJ65624.1 hypothetical protein VF03_27680 [Nostoc linckia z2]
MSAKLKLFLIVVLTIFATAGAGVLMTGRQQPPAMVDGNVDRQPQHIRAIHQSQEVVAYSERSNYKTIPLQSINSSLQGSDPATLALNAFDDVPSVGGTRKVEVAYPQRNQALVTITEIKQGNNSVDTVKYRVEMTTFGRSLFINSPPVWQIVWAGVRD